MDTSKLEKFAQAARRQLREQVAARMEQVLREDSAVLREQAEALTQLKEEIDQSSKQAVIDRAAYTWFNRFVALRYMDVNFYNPVRIVSPQEGYTQPEILQDAKTGVIDESLKVDKQRLIGLLNGEITSSNPQREVYRLLLLGKCQQLHDDLPFLFPEIEDFTALLLPEDLLSENSILQAVRDNLGQEDCKDVEVIGWLYQYYISEKKDEVIGSKKKIQPEDIPAATQLFTPHWIVRYLVENSLGRLWLLNYPDSKIRELMDYYIEPVEDEEEYLEVSSPEELKICDPACGSGHMLTYAFDLLYAIYEEQGYSPSTIPSLILENNLFGMEISERAGHLAAFAMMMKAREKDNRFFEREVEPNICVFENVEFTEVELEQYMGAVGRDLFTGELEHALKQFGQAENFGSLIQPSLTNVKFIIEELNKRGIPQELFLHNTHKKVLKSLNYVSYLLPSRYHVVVTNPPYMSSKNMNMRVKEFGGEIYEISKINLFAMFIERGFEFVLDSGYNAMVTMQSWMFLPTFETLRRKLIKNTTIICLVQMANMVMRIAFGTVATVWKNHQDTKHKGHYSYIRKENIVNNEPQDFPAQNSRLSKRAGDDFLKIPSAPIAYWVSDNILNVFGLASRLSKVSDARNGITTGDNRRFLRLWFEVEKRNTLLNAGSADEASNSGARWFPYSKGGPFRKWYGNNTFLINWENGGYELKNFPNAYIRNPSYYFKEAITWSLTSSSNFGARYRTKGFIFDVNGMSTFVKRYKYEVLALLNSSISKYFLELINPTMAFQAGDIDSIPFIDPKNDSLVNNTKRLIEISKYDWSAKETAWSFREHPITTFICGECAIDTAFNELRNYWLRLTNEMRQLEEDNNSIYVRVFKLENELDPIVRSEDITLNINPDFNSGIYKSDQTKEALLLESTMKELISYSVGCMFGRYSLDEPGLILCNNGDTTETYLARIPDPSFMPDEDNVIPILEEGWFSDDITERFKEFLRVTFGEENFAENLVFIEKAIGRDIRSFFLKDFYDYHCKMYSKPFYGKRPIYWMFESPKGFFKALIYMHRYNKDTASIVLNDYLREFRAKLQAQRAHLERQKDNGSKQEQAQAEKERERIREMLADLKEYEDDILYPLATQQIEIDLDDGVDVNYPKFGKALAPR